MTFGNKERGLVVLERGAVGGYAHETMGQVFTSALARMNAGTGDPAL
jgi:hypothetical protein